MPDTSQIPVRKTTKRRLKEMAAAMDCTMIELMDHILIDWLDKKEKENKKRGL